MRKVISMATIIINYWLLKQIAKYKENTLDRHQI